MPPIDTSSALLSHVISHDTTQPPMEVLTCTCPCRGCIESGVPAAPPINQIERSLALALALAASESLRGRGIDSADPGATQAVELVFTRTTALARQVVQLIEEPQDGELCDRVQTSVEMLAANLVAALAGRPRLS